MKTGFILSFVVCCLLAGSAHAQEESGNIEMEDLLPTLRNLSTIQSFFEMHNVTYYPEILNEPMKAKDYEGDHKIAANMGVYMTDLAYTVGTKGYAVGNPSYGALMELAAKEGLADDFPDLIIARYADRDATVDSLMLMFNDILEHGDKYMSEKDKKEFHDFIIMGNYIEKLYVVAALVEKNSEGGSDLEAAKNLNRELLLFMAKQGDELDELSKLMIGYSSNVVDHKDLQKLVADYEKLKANKDQMIELSAEEIYKHPLVKDIVENIGKVRARVVE
ncbi:hypothetical protein [Mangrovibacterium diazotrophicum]|uniref:Uncharacterized protein n=1 Tax=Mangrovibacterium diazotrophicum TaxID=1261403 RepID=A0A419WAH8_9BACT|nr:hypothetical protein [Mangrovibacterium diazotrophicum]RKD92449.1 hypothetical protein BC643_2821 [Mangrovibacterium diazotrophicum]